MPNIPFPAILDSTMLNTYRSCRQKFFLEYLLHLRKKSLNINLRAGGAFAKGLEATRNAFYSAGLSEEQAIILGLKALIEKYQTPELFHNEVKTIDRMMGALVYYFDTYKLETDPLQPLYLEPYKPAVEVTFSIPMDTPHPHTKDPLIFCGRFDMIGQYKSLNFIIDEKTTKQLGPSYANQFELRAQLQGYIYGAAQHDHNITGFIVRAVAIYKNGYDTKEIMRYTSPHLQKMWLETTNRTLRRMSEDWKNNEWDYAIGDACHAYGGCPNLPICLSPHPEKVSNDYAIVKWNPLAREEELIRKDKHFPILQG